MASDHSEEKDDSNTFTTDTRQRSNHSIQPLHHLHIHQNDSTMFDRGGIATMQHHESRYGGGGGGGGGGDGEERYHPDRLTLPPLLPTSPREERILPSLQSPHAHTPYLQLPSPTSSSSNNPRRLRSASEATAHQPPFRTLFAPPPPPFGSSSQTHPSIDSISSTTSSTNPAYVRSDRVGSPTISNLPSLSRFSANIRRSNTISAVLHHGPSSLGGGGGGNGAIHRHPNQLPPPHRIFSRKSSDASSRSQFSSLPAPFAGSPSQSQHGSWQQSGHPQHGQSGTSLKEPLTPGAMSTSSSFSTNTTSSSIATAIAHHSATPTGLGAIAHSPSSSASTTKIGRSASMRSMADEAGMSGEEQSPSSRKMAKVHVPSACLNCKKAHLACDVNRPCRRCINLGKTDTCVDVRHKKRGRPRLRDRENSANSTTIMSASNSSSSPRQIGIPSTPPQYSQMHQNTPPFGATASGITRGRSISAASIGGGPNSISRGIGMAYGAPLAAQQQQQQQLQQEQRSSTWMILSTSLHCARNSANFSTILGNSYPDDLLGTFLLDLIHPADIGRVENMWNVLLKPVDVPLQPLYAHPDTIMAMPLDDLMSPAIGTVYLREENVRIAQISSSLDGRTSYVVRSIGLHLGGGTFGVDLYRKHTFDRAYIVASFW